MSILDDVMGEYGFAVPKAAYEQLQQHIAARQPVGQEPVEFDYPAFHQEGMGCGLEDRGITDRYEAMRYGFDEALDQMAAILDSIGPLYAAPAAQAVGLGQLPEGWRLSKKATCYQLSHGNDIIGNLVGPDAEANAALIANLIDSREVRP